MALEIKPDIYEARANKGQRNGSITVNAGSPVMKNNWGNGYNMSYGKDVGLLSYPPVTGLVPSSGLGKGSTSAISGEYDTRMNDTLTLYTRWIPTTG